LPALANPILAQQSDAAFLGDLAGSVVISTDSFVVRPLFFPGGSIGELAVHGTINDLAMVGATPKYLTLSLILEEGLELATLAEILNRAGAAARDAGTSIVAGDTKVIERSGDIGCLINVTGVGITARREPLLVDRIQPGDAILISGTIADHGIAVLGKREGLTFESQISSDTAPLHTLVQQLMNSTDVRFMRDPTRGGCAATCNEIAAQAMLGIELDETAIPINAPVRSACSLLGLDPLQVANEGKLIAVVPADQAELAIKTLRKHPLGRNACRIGVITSEHPGKVIVRTAFGSRRVVPMPAGELLPRIC
jgi:hydrogenase expression/formation protein HypE